MRFFFMAIVVFAPMTGAVLLGCEEGVILEDRGATPAVGCTPGQQQDCRCSGGLSGFQFCTEAGQAWSECFCSDAAKTATAVGNEPGRADPTSAEAASKLAVVWYSDDPYVAERIALMYTHNAKKSGWFDTVELIIWGPSQKLLIENDDVQSTVLQMMSDGVIVEACRACADLYGLTSQIEALGITVKYMGEPLTNMLQTDWEVLTF
jgi:hypothetical protein